MKKNCVECGLCIKMGSAPFYTWACEKCGYTWAIKEKIILDGPPANFCNGRGWKRYIRWRWLWKDRQGWSGVLTFTGKPEPSPRGTAIGGEFALSLLKIGENITYHCLEKNRGILTHTGDTEKLWELYIASAAAYHSYINHEPREVRLW